MGQFRPAQHLRQVMNPFDSQSLMWRRVEQSFRAFRLSGLFACSSVTPRLSPRSRLTQLQLQSFTSCEDEHIDDQRLKLSRSGEKENGRHVGDTRHPSDYLRIQARQGGVEMQGTVQRLPSTAPAIKSKSGWHSCLDLAIQTCRSLLDRSQ